MVIAASRRRVRELLRGPIQPCISPSLCVDCGVNVTPCPGTRERDPDGPPCGSECGGWEFRYMLRRAAWAEAAGDLRGPDALLCVGCVERRLGRRLAPDDFDPALPINTPRYAELDSERLLDRKGF
jgi:hypothetical protein